MPTYNVGAAQTYATITAAIAAIPTDLSGGGVQIIDVLDGTDLTEDVSVNGFINSSATDYIHITSSTGRFTLRTSSTGTYGYNANESYTKLDKVDLRPVDGHTVVFLGQNYCTVDDFTLISSNGNCNGVYGSSGTGTIASNGTISGQINNAARFIESVVQMTAYDPDYGFRNLSSAVDSACFDALYSADFSSITTITNCASSDTSGSVGLQSLTATTEFVDPANDDFTLQVGSALIGAGSTGNNVGWDQDTGGSTTVSITSVTPTPREGDVVTATLENGTGPYTATFNGDALTPDSQNATQIVFTMPDVKTFGSQTASYQVAQDLVVTDTNDSAFDTATISPEIEIGASIGTIVSTTGIYADDVGVAIGDVGYGVVTAGVATVVDMTLGAVAFVDGGTLRYWVQDDTDSTWGTYADEIVAGSDPAPILSLPTGSASGATVATGGVTTDDGSGTLYYYTSINSSELAATIKASGSTQVVSASGAQAVSVSGLTPETTYYIHYVQEGATSGESNVVSSGSFTTLSTSDIPPASRTSVYHIANYLRSLETYSSVQCNELVVEWLISEGVSRSQLNVMLYAYLGGLGYTGTFNDRIRKWSLDS